METEAGDVLERQPYVGVVVITTRDAFLTC